MPRHRRPSPATVALALAGLIALALFGGGSYLAAVSLGTAGYDLAAYRDAAMRLLAGEPLYGAGPITDGSYLYPPPSVLVFLPFALVPEAVARSAFALLSLAAIVVAIAILPVRGSVRATVLLLAGLDYATAHALSLGQVAPFLLLAYALAYRALPGARSGAALGLATLLRVAPIVTLVALLAHGTTRRSAIAGLSLVACILLAALPFLGVATYADYARVLTGLADATSTRSSVALAPALIAAGIDTDIALGAALALAACSLLMLSLVVRRGEPDRTLMATITVSLLVSSVLRDHYVLVLLVPVAYLLERRVFAAALIPLATSVPLVALAFVPPLVFPLAALLALLLIARAPRIAR